LAGESDEYRRGVAEGQILSRLANHDDHFKGINGSIGRLAPLRSRAGLIFPRQPGLAAGTQLQVIRAGPAADQPAAPPPAVLAAPRAERPDRRHAFTHNSQHKTDDARPGGGTGAGIWCAAPHESRVRCCLVLT
jgi:hypothetical protein